MAWNSCNSTSVSLSLSTRISLCAHRSGEIDVAAVVVAAAHCAARYSAYFLRFLISNRHLGSWAPGVSRASSSCFRSLAMVLRSVRYSTASAVWPASFSA